MQVLSSKNKAVIDNATILCGRELEAIKGHVVVKNGIIEKVSEGSYNHANKIDARRGIILPSFTNAHLHIADSVAKDVFAYEKIEKRVGRSGIKFEFIKRRKKVRHAIIDSLRFMRSSGIAAFCDFREGGVEGIEVLKNALSDFEYKHGNYFRAVILGRPEEENEKRGKWKEMRGSFDFLEKCDGFGVASLSRYDFGFLKKARKEAQRKNKIFAVHFAENKEKEGKEENFEKLLSLNPDFVVHLTNADEEMIREIKRRNIGIVICARANASFAAGLPNLKEIFSGFEFNMQRENYQKIALGTDNVMANSLNMLREAEFVFKLYRGLYREHDFRAETILACSTFLGREVLKLQGNEIEEGNIANFVCFRRGKYIYDPALYILHRAEIGDIKFAMI